ncbi:uncharacterized protein [Clytia hemisphaerica]|uniref:WH1 domain-containing protein n=1 Tax=Clytia hemisphaerica TaxID=252671 RepID=A0A7M5VB09_9CNID
MVVSELQQHKHSEYFLNNNNMSHQNVITVTSATSTSSDDCNCKTVNKMVIGANDLLRIRDRISELYFKQNVIVAPCLSKLYMARDGCDTTVDNQTTDNPDWVYFGMGIVALIYDHEQNDVKMTLFDRNEVRLMWCLKWTTKVATQMTMSNFYTITNNIEDQHIGILFENKDVAELIAQTISLIFESIKEARRYSGVDLIDTTKALLKPTFSLPLKRSLHKNEDRRGSLKDTLLRKVSRINSPTKEQLPQTKLRSATVHQFSGHMARRAIEISTDCRPKSDCTDQTRLLKLSRADSFRKMRSTSFDCESIAETPITTITKPKKSFSDESNKFKENLTKILFKKRRISRTQSLQVEDRKNSKVLENQSSGESNEDSKQYERSVKLIKPRAFTDTMLLCDSMKFVIEAGLTARNQRERKHWVKTLRTEDTPSTDLCVTEL